MKIIFISRSLSYECIGSGITDTSSKAFELGFINAMKKNSDVCVLHIGSIKKIDYVNGIEYVGGSPSWAGSFFWIIMWVHRLSKDDEVAVISTGYYPGLALALVYARFLGCKAFSFVYDSHYLAIRGMPFLKRIIANLYFEIGFYLIRKVNGLFVLNERFLSMRRVVTPYIKTRVGVSDAVQKRLGNAVCNRAGPINIVYAGTINYDNGIDLVINSLMLDKNLDVRFEVYGCGDGVERLKTYAISDGRISYGGRLNENELQARMMQADFLINLRDPVGVSAQYSFPSKLINFMATGIPVISNFFPGLDENYQDHLIKVDEFNEFCLLDTIRSLRRDARMNGIGANAADYIYKCNRWDVIASEIHFFIKGSLN